MSRILTLAAALSLASLHSRAQDADQDAPRTTREIQRETLRAEAEAWAGLEPRERRILAERSEYIYRLNDNLIIDGYEILHWQDFARSNVDRTIDDGREYFHYRRTDKFDALCGYERCPASFWFRGRLLNDPDVRKTLTPADFPDHAETIEEEARRLEKETLIDARAATLAAVEAHLHRTLPMLYAADPRTLREQQSSEFGWHNIAERRRTDQGFEMRFSAGFLGSAFAPRRYFSTDRASISSKDHRLSVAGFVTSPLDEKGLPIQDRFLLLPAVVGQHEPDPSRKDDAAHQLVYYSIEEPRLYRMSPRAVARALLAGEMEISHRELRIVEGKFRAIEEELDRPNPAPP